MATNVGDILRITDCQTLFGKELCNVLYYVVSAWTGNLELEDVVDAFVDTFISGVRPRQHPDLVHSNVKLENITNNTDFFEKTINVAGANPTATQAQPSFVAFSITKQRPSKLTRSGSIRIAGVSEGDTENNTTTLSEIEKAQLEDAVTAVIPITGTEGSASLSPIIIGTNAVTGLPDINRFQVFTSAIFRGVSTQRTRKAGFA